MLTTPADAYRLLTDLGASPRLLQHARLVSEVARELIAQIQALGVQLDAFQIELGAILHDAGKIVHPQELSGPGNLHEAAGKALLLSHGVQPGIARICLTHANPNLPETTIEDNIVSLADKLWKEKRDADLELAVIDEVATRINRSRWDIFDTLDTTFETIAHHGAARLERTRSS